MTAVAHQPRIMGGRDVGPATAVAAENEERILLELAEQLGRVGHWRMTLPDYLITWSTEVYRIHGVTADHYTPDIATAISFYHPDDRDLVRTAIAIAVLDGTPFEFALRLMRADGEVRHVKSRGVTIADLSGVPAMIFGVFIDVTDQQRLEEALFQANLKLEQLAYVDALTKLANRRHFDATLEREWRRAIREETSLSLVMLDIDRFKEFNDAYGHLAGDDCLRIVAAAVAQVVCRPGDLVARYGGEEFALILPVTEAAGAGKIANDARMAIEALGLAHQGNISCGSLVTASFGVATTVPHRGDAPLAGRTLIAEADGLLYEAKRMGRNRVVSAATIAKIGIRPLPPDEAARLATLALLEQAGATRRNAELDRIAQLAATLMSAPIGLVSLVGQEEQSFIGNFGLEGIDATGRDASFCAHTILAEQPFVVPDATKDARFEENPLVLGELGMRYYAGAPIIHETTKHRLGAVCVIDNASRPQTSPAERALLADLAKMVALLIEKESKSLKPRPV